MRWNRTFIVILIASLLVSLSIDEVNQLRLAKAQEATEIKMSLIIYARTDFGSIGDNTDIFSLALEDSNATNLTKNPAEDILPVVNANRDRIAFLSDRNSRGIYELYVMDMDGDNVVQLTENGKVVIAPVTWSSDGNFIIYTSFRNQSYDLYAVNVDTGEEANLTESDFNDYNPSWSPDGDSVAFIREGLLYVMDFVSRDTTLLYEGERWNETPVWSPNGARIAFASYVNPGDVNKSNFDLFVIEIDTQEVTRITELSGDDTTPAWSPDGEYIGFQSSPGNIGETLISTIIAIVRSDGSEPPTAVTTDLANDRCPVWTNDGDGILFTSDRKAPFESSDIYLISPSDGNLIQLTTTEGGETCPLNFVSFEQTIENTMP